MIVKPLTYRRGCSNLNPIYPYNPNKDRISVSERYYYDKV